MVSHGTAREGSLILKEIFAQRLHCFVSRGSDWEAQKDKISKNSWLFCRQESPRSRSSSVIFVLLYWSLCCSAYESRNYWFMTASGSSELYHLCKIKFPERRAQQVHLQALPNLLPCAIWACKRVVIVPSQWFVLPPFPEKKSVPERQKCCTSAGNACSHHHGRCVLIQGPYMVNLQIVRTEQSPHEGCIRKSVQRWSKCQIWLLSPHALSSRYLSPQMRIFYTRQTKFKSQSLDKATEQREAQWLIPSMLNMIITWLHAIFTYQTHDLIWYQMLCRFGFMQAFVARHSDIISQWPSRLFYFGILVY